MVKSITYFQENCIKKFEKMENDFLRNPLNMAEYVYGITEELHKLGLVPNQRLTEDARAEMLKEAVQTSYRCGAERTSLATEVSRQTVKNKIHALCFPPDNDMPGKKKQVDYVYLDADEDHVALQFREKKGDIEKAENGIKNNSFTMSLKNKKHILVLNT